MPDLWERALVRDVAQLAEHLDVTAHAHILPQVVWELEVRDRGKQSEKERTNKPKQQTKHSFSISRAPKSHKETIKTAQWEGPGWQIWHLTSVWGQD